MPATSKWKSKNCSVCGSTFTCGAMDSNQQCWCNDFPAIMPLDFGQDCRCPECLKKIVAEKIAEFMNLPKAIFCWSGGKDSAYGLHKLRLDKTHDVQYLLTTINDTSRRVSMHGVREELLDRQAEAAGIKLLKVRVSEGTNSEYERQMEAVLLNAKAQGIHHVIFGDIFLEDLRAYREKNLQKVGMQGVFPLWKMDSQWLIHDFIRRGFKSITCCVNDSCLGKEWVGKEIDAAFVRGLPAHVDPCGENGEFHTFCHAGPLFKKAISFSLGEKVYKALEVKTDNVCPSSSNTKGFWFCDLIPR